MSSGLHRGGMVTSPHDLASKAGLAVLVEGGNAMEAAIAVGATLAVTYPHFCGLGGDAVWLVADREGRQTCFLGIGQAAAHYPKLTAIPPRGPLSALTSACAVDSWGHAHDFSQRYWNGKRSFASLLDAAIGHAENGFPLPASQRHWNDFRTAETPSWRGFSRAFPDVPAGTNFAQPELARSLAAIARHGPREFYEGSLALRIAEGLGAAGSPITADDLAKTRTREAPPLSLGYHGKTLLAPPPPTQGLTTLTIMGILAALTDRLGEEGSVTHFHYCIEAVKRAFLERQAIADPDFHPLDIDALLAPQRLAEMATGIDDRALPWPHPFRTGDTVFFAATDAEGRGVSVLQSIYYDWGSGVIAGDTGILWQNRGAAFSCEPNHPNMLAPGKRPFYTLNPGLALKDGKPFLLYGTQGADGQPQTLSLLLTRLLDYGLTPEQALQRARFLLGRTFSDSRDSLKLEAAVDDGVTGGLAARGHLVSPIPALSPLAGQAGIIRIAEDGFLSGAHDPRSDGTALAL